MGRGWFLGCRLVLPSFSAGWFQRHLRILRFGYTVVSVSVSRVVKVVVWAACCCRKHFVGHRPSSSASLLAVCWLGVFGKLSGLLLLCGCRSGFCPPFSACQIWAVCCHYQAVGIGFLFGLAGWAFWFVAGGFGGFGLVSVGCCRAGGVGFFPVVRLCGAAGFSGSGQASSSCPTSQSKGLPAVP